MHMRNQGSQAAADIAGGDGISLHSERQEQNRLTKNASDLENSIYKGSPHQHGDRRAHITTKGSDMSTLMKNHGDVEDKV